MEEIKNVTKKIKHVVHWNSNYNFEITKEVVKTIIENSDVNKSDIEYFFKSEQTRLSKNSMNLIAFLTLILSIIGNVLSLVNVAAPGDYVEISIIFIAASITGATAFLIDKAVTCFYRNKIDMIVDIIDKVNIEQKKSSLN